MPAQLTTHVLDTMHGTPAAGLKIVLFQLEENAAKELKIAVTNSDGRTDIPMLSETEFATGQFELVFHVGDYFTSQGVDLPEPMFLDTVPIRFAIADVSAKYHVPLLVSPWAYSTYRGS
ncbi:MAG: hydroxyisourate hydrolase [Deinococcota bacterium]